MATKLLKATKSKNLRYFTNAATVVKMAVQKPTVLTVAKRVTTEGTAEAIQQTALNVLKRTSARSLQWYHAQCTTGTAQETGWRTTWQDYVYFAAARIIT